MVVARSKLERIERFDVPCVPQINSSSDEHVGAVVVADKGRVARRGKARLAIKDLGVDVCRRVVGERDPWVLSVCSPAKPCGAIG